jgi:hypothetical protein
MTETNGSYCMSSTCMFCARIHFASAEAWFQEIVAHETRENSNKMRLLWEGMK